MIFFVKNCLSRRPYSDQGVATELSWRSITFLRCSWWRFSALSRCFHCASTALTAHAPRFHGVPTALRTQWHLQERRAVSVQTPRSTTAFAQRPLCAPTELLLRCRRPYCAAMVTLRRPLCALLGRRANAEWQCLFEVCSKCAPSLGVLWDPTVSNDDATALLWWCLRLYCAHLGVLQCFRTPWDHREDVALVWQGFNCRSWRCHCDLNAVATPWKRMRCERRWRAVKAPWERRESPPWTQ